MRNKQFIKHRYHKMRNNNPWILLKDESDEELTPEILEEQLEVAKTWILKNISRKWRHWKNCLKSTGFDPSKTVDEMVEANRIYGGYIAEISIINQENRLKLDESLIAQEQSHLLESWRRSKAPNGIPPSHAEMYIMSRAKEDGTLVCNKATEIVEKMKMHMNESGNSSYEQELSWENNVYSKVKGPEKKGVFVAKAIYLLHPPNQDHQPNEVKSTFLRKMPVTSW
ncbi:Transposase, Ptta/En/Spm, plant [Corchorus olitorius]|uniref:Transposase, Ptta/En/Spm, plant n=1 Tax=Corchorus olitorius TaxID=93759 RepID=A0A1R3FY38_9ROSI|nr:Transposase, Ptta/En/Spm, plant [Corchorus olitorius]